MRRVIGLLLLLTATAAGQSGTGWGNPPPAAIAGVGYTMPPAFLRTAPGQIVSLMVYGLNYTQAAPFVATSLPLPTSLGGVSVTLVQGLNKMQVPLLSVQQVCAAAPCAP